MKFFVVTYRPPLKKWPDLARRTRVRAQVYREDEWDVAALSNATTSVWRVENVRTKGEAIAVVLEKAAGKDVTAYKIA